MEGGRDVGRANGNGGRALVVYYSRTGNVAKVAEEVAGRLGADLERIIDRKDRSGLRGWLRSGSDGTRRRPADIVRPSRDPVDYDLIVVGTSIWNKSMTTPVRTYMKMFDGKFPEVAFFIVTGFNRYQGTLPELRELAGKAPVATMVVQDKELKQGAHIAKARAFAEQLAGRGADPAGGLAGRVPGTAKNGGVRA